MAGGSWSNEELKKVLRRTKDGTLFFRDIPDPVLSRLGLSWWSWCPWSLATWKYDARSASLPATLMRGAITAAVLVMKMPTGTTQEKTRQQEHLRKILRGLKSFDVAAPIVARAVPDTEAVWSVLLQQLVRVHDSMPEFNFQGTPGNELGVIDAPNVATAAEQLLEEGSRHVMRLQLLHGVLWTIACVLIAVWLHPDIPTHEWDEMTALASMGAVTAGSAALEACGGLLLSLFVYFTPARWWTQLWSANCGKFIVLGVPSLVVVVTSVVFLLGQGDNLKEWGWLTKLAMVEAPLFWLVSRLLLPFIAAIGFLSRGRG